MPLYLYLDAIASIFFSSTRIIFQMGFWILGFLFFVSHPAFTFADGYHACREAVARAGKEFGLRDIPAAGQVVLRRTSKPVLSLDDRTIVLQRTIYQMGDLKVQVSHPEIEVGSGEQPIKKKNYQRNLNEWRKHIAENVDFAISQYPRRHWPESFFKELREAAQKEWMNTRYITVYDKTGKIVGTMRFISSRNKEVDAIIPYITQITGGTWGRDVVPPPVQARWWGEYWKKLPIEKALGINLERPFWFPAEHPELPTSMIGESIEPGNYAVAKNSSPLVHQALSVEFMKAVFDPNQSSDYNSKGKMLYTYADEIGKRLYVPLGFDLVNEKDPIEHGGTKWWVLRMSPDKLKDWIEGMNRRAKWTDEDAEKLQMLFSAFSRPWERAGEASERGNPLQHGLIKPRVYSVDERVNSELNQIQDRLRNELEADLNGVQSNIAAPYESLLLELNAARVTKGIPIDLREYGEMDLIRNDERPIVGIRFYGGRGNTIELRPADQIPHHYLSEKYLIQKYGDLWEAKRVFYGMLLNSGSPYYDHLEVFNTDLKAAIVEEVQERSKSGGRELSSKQMNDGIITKMWKRYKAKGGY